MTFVMRIIGNMAPTLAQRLDAEERRVLRATGRVPDWFLDAVRKRYRELRRGRL